MMTEEVSMNENIKLCACGCGQEVKNRFRKGHYINILNRINILENHPKWKGGRKIDVYGYVLVKLRNYRHCNNQGYVFEHRYIYEQYHKCCLLPWIVIHHKNEIRNDNRIENLEPMTHKEHHRLHKLGKSYVKKDMSDRICLKCNFQGRIHWRKYKDRWICNKCYLKLYYRNNRKLL